MEFSLTQNLDELTVPDEIPDPARMPMSVEVHTHACSTKSYLTQMDRLEGWKRLGQRRMFWLVVWRDVDTAVFFKREWAREFIRELKVAWIHEV